MALTKDELRNTVCDFKCVHEVYLTDHFLLLSSCIKSICRMKTSRTKETIRKANE